MSDPALDKHTAFGFQVQDDEGTEVNDTVIWTPFNDRLDFKLRTNRTVYRQADYNDYIHLLYSSGIWSEGGAPISLIPDATMWASLIVWLQTRDAYNQGKWASVYLYDTTIGIRAFMDVKVREFNFRFTRGEPVRLDLQLVGKKPGTGTPIPTLTGRRLGPYLWKETEVQLDMGNAGGSLAVTVDIESAELRGDNMIHSPEEGLRITDSNGAYPQKLYNIGGMNVTGSFSRDFLDTTAYATYVALGTSDFAATYDASVQFLMTRVTTATALVNRMQLMEHAADYAGSNEGRLVESVDWQGLGSTTGADAPLTLS